MNHSQREKACAKLNQELGSKLGYRDMAQEYGQDVGSKISMDPVSKVPYSPFWGSIHFGIVEHCLVYDTKDNKPYKGEWMRKEKTRIERPVLDSFTGDYVKKVIVSESLQSPQNSVENARKWANRNRMKSAEARKLKSVVTSQRVSKAQRADTEALMEVMEASIPERQQIAGDYRKYFR